MYWIDQRKYHDDWIDWNDECFKEDVLPTGIIISTII